MVLLRLHAYALLASQHVCQSDLNSFATLAPLPEYAVEAGGTWLDDWGRARNCVSWTLMVLPL